MSEPKPRRRELDDDDERDEVRDRKKKKKKKQRAPARWPMIAAFAGVGVVALGVVGLIIWVIVGVAGGGPPARPVTAWEKFSTDELGFAFEYPAGWRAKGSTNGIVALEVMVDCGG